MRLRLLVALLCVGVLVAGCSGKGKPNQANFDKIKEGMSAKEVEDLMGAPKESADLFGATMKMWEEGDTAFVVFIIPFISIVPALLYLKMRQLGGEKLSDVMAQIEEVDAQSRAWQKRMRTRISLYTPTSHRTTGNTPTS